jgi:hypothetical protein
MIHLLSSYWQKAHNQRFQIEAPIMVGSCSNSLKGLLPRSSNLLSKFSAEKLLQNFGCAFSISDKQPDSYLLSDEERPMIAVNYKSYRAI